MGNAVTEFLEYFTLVYLIAPDLPCCLLLEERSQKRRGGGWGGCVAHVSVRRVGVRREGEAAARPSTQA